MTYYKRNIDKKLMEWKASQRRKPLLIRGARQVGKSSAVRHLGKEFKYFVEINLESQPSIRGLFSKDIDVHRTCEGISATTGIPVIPGETLLFIDEIQVSQEAIMSLRCFKEDYPELHVIGTGYHGKLQAAGFALISASRRQKCIIGRICQEGPMLRLIFWKPRMVWFYR